MRGDEVLIVKANDGDVVWDGEVAAAQCVVATHRHAVVEVEDRRRPIFHLRQHPLRCLIAATLCALANRDQGWVKRAIVLAAIILAFTFIQKRYIEGGTEQY